MNTSYFAKYRGDKGVSIAIKKPPGCDVVTYAGLCPTPDILLRYKRTGDVERYVMDYHSKVLSLQDPAALYYFLKDNVLLCWEGPDKFCHRRIVAKWFEDSLGIEVPEL